MQVDLNCDMGEGYGNDEELMKYISSANIACGYHAGDEDTMRSTAEFAIKNNVAIGAHPSFADRENFGRKNMNLSADEVYELTFKQISILSSIVSKLDARLHHVKPHGALYNMAAKDIIMADAIAKAIADFDGNLFFYGLANSEMATAAKKFGIKYCAEVFADRTYEPDGSLTLRTKPNALIEDIGESVNAALRMVEEQQIICNDKTKITVQADTICLHGDGSHALDFARTISGAFKKKNIHVKAPAN